MRGLANEGMLRSLTMEIKIDTHELRKDTSEIKETIKQDTALILAEIARLQKQLPQDQLYNTGFMLQRYLDNLTSYAETVCDTFSDKVDVKIQRRRSMESGVLELSDPPSPVSWDSTDSKKQCNYEYVYLARSKELCESGNVTGEPEPEPSSKEFIAADAVSASEKEGEDEIEDSEVETPRKEVADGDKEKLLMNQKQAKPENRYNDQHLETYRKLNGKRPGPKTIPSINATKTSIDSDRVEGASMQQRKLLGSLEQHENVGRGKNNAEKTPKNSISTMQPAIINSSNIPIPRANENDKQAEIQTNENAAKSPDNHKLEFKSFTSSMTGHDYFPSPSAEALQLSYDQSARGIRRTQRSSGLLLNLDGDKGLLRPYNTEIENASRPSLTDEDLLRAYYADQRTASQSSISYDDFVGPHGQAQSSLNSFPVPSRLEADRMRSYLPQPCEHFTNRCPVKLIDYLQPSVAKSSSNTRHNHENVKPTIRNEAPAQSASSQEGNVFTRDDFVTPNRQRATSEAFGVQSELRPKLSTPKPEIHKRAGSLSSQYVLSPPEHSPRLGSEISNDHSDAWSRQRVDAEEVQELLRCCTQELKSKGAPQ